MDLSIIIPAYNEEKVIASTIENYIQFFRQQNKSFELIVIPNNCKDRTVEIVDMLSKRNKEIKYKNLLVKGKGVALIEGFKLAQGDLIVYVDADNATKPETVATIISNIGDADAIMGSRWLKRSLITKPQPLVRRFASRGFNLYVRLLLGLQFTDTQAGAKVFRKEAIKKILSNIRPEGWAFDVGVLYLLQKQGFKIREIPIVWEDNPDSHLTKRSVVQMFLSVLRIRLRK
ncbi:MAG TPA: glycosyltransferase [Candidatus Nanoarchaeia archaeon]|nr:glycosyltransferase [Candidatus Nanoarchaeia archaeon]